MTACGQNSTPATSGSNIADPRQLALPASQDGRFSVDSPPSFQDHQAKPSGPFAEVKPLEIRKGGSLGTLGLNLETYFAGNISDTNGRLERLEGAVGAMHKDLKILAPAMQRLALIENDLQDLITQLEAVLQEEASPQRQTNQATTPPVSMAPPTQATPIQVSPAPAVTPPAVTAPPTPIQATPPVASSATGSQRVTGLRFGGSGGKTRIVFDADKPVTYTKDLDNGESLLVIEMPDTSWSAAPQGKGPAASVIDSWTAQPTGSGGSRIVMVLKKPVTIAYEGKVGPESDNPHHRLVLDLMAN